MTLPVQVDRRTISDTDTPVACHSSRGGATNTQRLIPNNLRSERLAAGITEPADLAERAGIDPQWYQHLEEGRVLPQKAQLERIVKVLGDIAPSRLYLLSWRQLIGLEEDDDGMAGMSTTWRVWRDKAHMLMSRDELSWNETKPLDDHHADVYMNLSCGTQASPHLLLDTVAVLEALGVSFVAAAGPGAGCCGKPFACKGRMDAFERHSTGRVERSRKWGATTHVNWCGACQQTSTNAAAHRRLELGIEHPVREIQLLPFLEERIRELGGSVPWKVRPGRRVLAEGHPWSPVHEDARTAMAGLLALVPSVEVVGVYDGFDDDSPCTSAAREPHMTPPAWTQRPETGREREAHIARLTETIRGRGADTVSCMHQTCHQIWSAYAGNGFSVTHAVSILAEALGVSHPDRYQEALRFGDADELVEHSRPRWESWGMPEERAREIARSLCDPASASAQISYAAHYGHCNDDLIPTSTVLPS